MIVPATAKRKVFVKSVVDNLGESERSESHMTLP